MQQTKSGFKMLVVLLLFEVSLFCLASADPALLVKGQEYANTVGLEYPVSYKISLKKGDSLRLKVNQISVFASVAISLPDGRLAAQSSRAWSYPGPFLISMVAEADGDYGVNVSALGFFDQVTKKEIQAEHGEYRLVIVDLFSEEECLEQEKKRADDPRVAFLREHASPLSDMKAANEDFSDLEPLKKAIGSSRIVFLGEQVHGTAQTYEGKTRLAKFLHQEMGFEILAMESGFVEVNQLRERMSDGVLEERQWAQGIMIHWTGAHEFEPMMGYLQASLKTPKPLAVWGLDNQFRFRQVPDYMEKALTTLFAEHDVSFDPEARFLFELLPAMITIDWYKGVRPPASDIEKNRFGQGIQWFISHLETFEKQKASHRNRFWLQALRTLQSRVPQGFATKDEVAEKASEFGRQRDTQMGKNLIWLAEEFPDKKIIVWAASSHLARDYNLVRKPYKYIVPGGYQTIGSVAEKALGDQIYSIMFTAYQGTYGNQLINGGFREEINPDQHEEMELEELLALAGKENAFLDLKSRKSGDQWLYQPLRARPFGHCSHQAVWPQIVDGFVFTQRVTPLTLADYMKQYYKNQK